MNKLLWPYSECTMPKETFTTPVDVMELEFDTMKRVKTINCNSTRPSRFPRSF